MLIIYVFGIPAGASIKSLHQFREKLVAAAIMSFYKLEKAPRCYLVPDNVPGQWNETMTIAVCKVGEVDFWEESKAGLLENLSEIARTSAFKPSSCLAYIQKAEQFFFKTF